MEFKGKIQNWIRHITGISQKHLHSFGNCWRNTEDYAASTAQSTPVQRCTGSPCAGASPYVSVPIMLMVETIASGWDCPEKITLLRKSKNGPAIVYELVSRVFYGHNHYISRHSRQIPGRKQSQVFLYDDMDNGGTSVLLSPGKPASQIAGYEDQLTPELKAGFKTYMLVYQLSRGREAQQEFYRHQLSLLRRHHPMVSISTDNVEHLPDAIISLKHDTLVVVDDEDRLWYSPTSSRQRAGKTDYNTIAPRQKTRTQPTLHQASSSASLSPSSSSVSDSPELPSSSGSSVSPDPPRPAEDISETHQKQRECSPHPVRCRCGRQGDGNLMTDRLNTIRCMTCGTYSHLACQRQGRANHLPPGGNFECDECLGYDVMLPRSENW